MKRIALLALLACFVGTQFAGTALAGNSKPVKVKTFLGGGFHDGGQ